MANDKQSKKKSAARTIEKKNANECIENGLIK